MTVRVREVAAAAGVSVGTVSNVLNRPEIVSEDTVARVHAAIERLGYVRNDAARQLRVGRSRNLGLIVPDVGNPFYGDVIRGAERRAAESGLTVLLGNSDQDSAREAAHLDMFREQRVAGVLLSPASGDSQRLEGLSAAGVPVVLVDGEADGVPSVSADDVSGGRLAAAHLLELGRRRILFIGGSLGIRQVAHRLEGARSAVVEVAGATLDVRELPALSVVQGRAAGQAVLGAAAAGGELPDAIMCANDLLAVGVLQALAMMSDVRVPADIALIGYDDIAFAASAVVPLSSIRQPADLIGYTAADLLIRGSDADVDADTDTDADATPEAIHFAPELVARASTTG